MRARSPLWLLTLPLATGIGAPGAPVAHAAPASGGDAGPAAGRPAARASAGGGSEAGARPTGQVIRATPSGGGAMRAADPFADAPKADMSSTTDLSQSWGYASKSEAQPRYVEMESQSVSVAPNPIGFYSGVRADASGVAPPWAPADPASSPPILTWPGFERGTTSSRVFFQVSRAVPYEVQQEGRTIRVRLAGTHLNVKNNRRPLDLRYHRTPVAKVVVRPGGEDAVATLTLKRDAVPQVRTVQAENGYMVLILDFPDPQVAPSGPISGAQ